jgi:transglutaminase-like putative cysteine protease
MKLLVRHQTSYGYEAGTSRVAMLLKLKPRDHDGQSILDWTVTVNDEPLTDFAVNGYGDAEALWIRHQPLVQATIVAQGMVETRDTNGLVTGLWERIDPRAFLRETTLTAPSDAIAALAVGAGGEDTLARLHALCGHVRDAVDYRPNVTGSETTAAQALSLGAGVCQDHAHVFIAAARAMDVPARYVTGYLLAEEEGHVLHETHGWAEAHVAGLGWIGFDPSNRVCVTDRYIRIAGGMDAHDAAPVRGLATFAGESWIDADVRIAQASEDASEQQLQMQQQQQCEASGEPGKSKGVEG